MKSALLRRSMLVLLLATATCTETPTGPPAPPVPVPGTLVVRLTTPNQNDAAIVVRLSGPDVTQLQSGNAAYQLHTRAAGASQRIALFGTLTTGPVLRFHVPDVARLSEYSAQVVEVADDSNDMRAELAGYDVAIERHSP